MDSAQTAEGGVTVAELVISIPDDAMNAVGKLGFFTAFVADIARQLRPQPYPDAKKPANVTDGATEVISSWLEDSLWGDPPFGRNRQADRRRMREKLKPRRGAPRERGTVSPMPELRRWLRGVQPQLRELAEALVDCVNSVHAIGGREAGAPRAATTRLCFTQYALRYFPVGTARARARSVLKDLGLATTKKDLDRCALYLGSSSSK
jgi:hypothetical protein